MGRSQRAMRAMRRSKRRSGRGENLNTKVLIKVSAGAIAAAPGSGNPMSPGSRLFDAAYGGAKGFTPRRTGSKLMRMTQAAISIRLARPRDAAAVAAVHDDACLAGGAEGLFGQVTRHTADMLRAERGLVLLYDRGKRELVAQLPGYGITQQQMQRIRYPAEGEARSRWDFRINGALLSNDAQADARLLPELIKELGPRSLMIAPIIRGHAILGLLAVADRIGDTPFTDDDLELLRALAGQATIAVENLRLNQELRSANEQLQEFDRLKNQFVGIVAHDFRKPLMAIRGFAELVLEDQDLSVEARREFMKTVISESEQLAELANDTLSDHPNRDRAVPLRFPRDRPRPVPAGGRPARPRRALGAGQRARPVSPESGPTPIAYGR